jgi:hypothetical protein
VADHVQRRHSDLAVENPERKRLDGGRTLVSSGMGESSSSGCAGTEEVRQGEWTCAETSKGAVAAISHGVRLSHERLGMRAYGGERDCCGRVDGVAGGWGHGVSGWARVSERRIWTRRGPLVSGPSSARAHG